jgi:hypothetical protein
MTSLTFSIYKITHNDDNTQFYIGSTIRISSRKAHHKKNCTNKVGKSYWCYLYQYIRANGGWDSFTFEILETFQYESKTLVREKEQEFINKLSPTLNSVKAFKN